MTTLRVTKTQREELEQMVQTLVFEGRVQIENELQHKAALQLVEAGAAVVSKKKNYGRIAEIKNKEGAQ